MFGLWLWGFQGSLAPLLDSGLDISGSLAPPKALGRSGSEQERACALHTAGLRCVSLECAFEEDPFDLDLSVDHGILRS